MSSTLYLVQNAVEMFSLDGHKLTVGHLRA